MLCIHQNQSSSFNGPISHPSSSTNLDLFQSFNCDEDFQDINLADFSIDVHLDDSLDQMFNSNNNNTNTNININLNTNQQSITSFDSPLGLSSGYSTPTSSSFSTSTSISIPTPTSSDSAISSPLSLNLLQHHLRSSSELSFSQNTDISSIISTNTDTNTNSNNNTSSNTCNDNSNLILSNNQVSLIGSTETSLSSTPTTPTSATLPSFMEIYSPRNFPPQSSSNASLNQQPSQSGLTPVVDDGSSFFKFDEIGDLNDDDNTSLSTVSFGSVSLQKSGQATGSLIDLSFIKQEDEQVDDDIDLGSVSLPIQFIHQQQQQQQSQSHPRVNQQQQYRLTHNQDVNYTRASSVASSPGYISLSSTRSTPNPDHYQHQQPNYQQPPQQQYHHQSLHHHHHHYLQQQINYHHHLQQQQQQQSTQIQSVPRSSYQPIGSPITSNTTSSGSNHPSLAIEHSLRSQMNISRSSFSSSLSGSPNIFSLNNSVLGFSSRTSSGRSSPTELVPISGCSRSKASTSSSSSSAAPAKGDSSSFASSLSLATTSAAGSSVPIQEKPGQPLHQLCAVCGDNAACQHYGVRTCEGCKGFFKRTVQKGSKYVCLGTKDCTVDKRRRNRCQFCRFQKCLAVGMVKEVVRTDNLKGRRGRLPSKPKSPQENPPSPPVSTITALVRAHVDTCPDLSSLDLSQYREIDESCLSLIGSSPAHHQQFVNLINTSMDPMRTFAEKIPGFNDLNKHDQDLLFNSSCLEMIALRIAYQNKPGSKKIILPNGVVLHRNQVKLLFGSWFNNLELFSSRFAQIDIDISAFACLLGLSLITVRHGLVEPLRVEGLQMKIIESLRDHVTYNAEAQKKVHYFSAILSKLPDLRSLSMDGLTHLHRIKLESIITIPESLTRLLNNIALY